MGSVGEGDNDEASVRERLAGLDELPVSEHADTYQEIHAELQRALADIDDA